MGKGRKNTKKRWKELFFQSVKDTVNLHMEVLSLRDRIKNLEEDKSFLQKDSCNVPFEVEEA